MSKLSHVLLLTLTALCLAACGEAPPAQKRTPETASYLVAVNRPLQYFAQRLLGENADVRMPAPADIDPATWNPGVKDIQLLQEAELVLLNGAGYSPWLTRVSLADNRLVVTAADKDRWIELADQVTHSHGPEGEHAHGGYAFTTWMDLSLAAEQATTLSGALQQYYPEQAQGISAREAELLAELAALDQGFAATARYLEGRALIYSHPVYQYFAARYGLPGLSLHWEPDVMPSEDEWSSLVHNALDNTLFVWEGEPDSAIADRLAALGIAQLTLDPGANEQGDWLALQQRNLDRLKALTEQP